jgi:hypothetical protein
MGRNIDSFFIKFVFKVDAIYTLNNVPYMPTDLKKQYKKAIWRISGNRIWINGKLQNSAKCLHFLNAIESVTEANKKCMMMIQVLL